MKILLNLILTGRLLPTPSQNDEELAKWKRQTMGKEEVRMSSKAKHTRTALSWRRSMKPASLLSRLDPYIKIRENSEIKFDIYFHSQLVKTSV